MVGDIDFIFSKDDYPKAISILLKYGYVEVIKTDYNYPMFKHYPRLVKENEIAAIEIHKELLLEKYASEFNYKIVEKDSQVINGVKDLSFANKLNLSIISRQINDNNFYFKTITLRNAYDVFLLSKKTNAKYAVNKLDKLRHLQIPYLFRIYQTANGYHVFLISHQVDYYNLSIARLMKHLGCDPWYIAFTFKNGFRVRLNRKITRKEPFVRKWIGDYCLTDNTKLPLFPDPQCKGWLRTLDNYTLMHT